MKNPIIQYEELFSSKPFVRGKEPSQFALETLQYATGRMALDLGCGEGQDSLVFAEKGLIVKAIDASITAITHANQSADKRGIVISWVCEDVLSFECWKGRYDFIYTDGLLHFFEDDTLSRIITTMQERTNASGVNAIGVFDQRTSEWEKNELTNWGVRFESISMIERLYSQWAVLKKDKIISKQGNGKIRGITHLIFRKPHESL